MINSCRFSFVLVLLASLALFVGGCRSKGNLLALNPFSHESQSQSAVCDELFATMPEAIAKYRTNSSKAAAHDEENSTTWRAGTRSLKSVAKKWSPAIPKIELAEQVEPQDCKKILASQFKAGGGEISFTVGHIPETCDETPQVIWHAHHAAPVTQELAEIQGYDVDNVWCVGEYLVMHLQAVYEYSNVGSGLAFWNLKQGSIRTVFGGLVGGLDGDMKPIADPTDPLTLFLHHLGPTTVVRLQANAVMMQQQAAILAFWPARMEWSLISVTPAPITPSK